MHPRWVLSFLFFAFDCSLEILERKDCWYLEGKWVRDGQKYIWRENGYQNSFFCMWIFILFYFIYFILFFFFDFGCSLEMFERNDYLYLEGKWVTIVFGGKMG